MNNDPNNDAAELNATDPADPLPSEPIPAETLEADNSDATAKLRQSTPLHYAPVYPAQKGGSIGQLGYARPGTYRRKNEGYPAAMFVLGMVAPFVYGWLAFVVLSSFRADIGGALVALFVLVVAPAVMFGFRATRMVGAGWITSLALVFLILLALCGGAFR